MNRPDNGPRRLGILAVIGPGLLVAATGVGAGDLATAGFAGSKLGMAILWAVLVGAFLKFVINEGLARWQIATGETLLEGAIGRLGWPVVCIFLPYLLIWSFYVARALMSACGVAIHAMVPVFDSADDGKCVFGIASGAVGLVCVWFGGFRLFERVMAVCIAVMFVTVVVTAVLLKPDVGQVVTGIVLPRIPYAEGKGPGWTVALMGGVGGTLTVLCYGYWIREKGRTRPEDLRICRIDLAVAYAATALFGLAMVVIASQIEVEGKGAKLVVHLADRLEEPLGTLGRWVFLVGAFGAVFSSLLGVWQAVPYLFADFWGMTFGPKRSPTAEAGPVEVDTSSWPYRLYLVAIAIVPMRYLAPQVDFRQVQKVYAIVGALSMPLLAIVLLVLNGRRDWVGPRWRNRWPTVVVLVLTILFFLCYGYAEVAKAFGWPVPGG